MCIVFLIILLSIITTSPLAHAQLPFLGPIFGPILGQPAPPIVPPVGGQVPPVVPPIVPPVVQVPPIVPPVGGQVVNITIVGSLSCSVPGSNVPGSGVGGVNVTIICGNTTIAQASTNSQGIINVSVLTTTSVLSGNTCIARIPLPIANCTLFPNTGTLQAPVILIGNLIQNVVNQTFFAIFGILTSLITVT
ncbi:hypothetical protein H5410_047924 [Solanum commersonii]|uniref:Uncharacterized protein n=1 Tax=Solanum commersonii TaxID=4109 RepID=A0A9J5XIH8_SOLCO|nr:hypothetical protein H5410_047924 [Solanum commersonii]